MAGFAVNNSPPADWPAILAAASIRDALLGRISGDVRKALAESSEGWTPISLSEGSNGFGISLLKRFLKSIANPVGHRRVKQWFRFLSEANQLALDHERQATVGEAEILWERFSRLKPERFEDVLREKSNWKDLYRLFELLLGMCIMRPIIGDAPTESSVYYSAIDHPLIDENTKQLILESVLVPPGGGSIGRCFREGSYCVNTSFADYAGVVEWQDLIQGNISILMVRVDTDSYHDTRTKEHLSYVVMAFFPLSDIFSETICPLKEPAETDRLSSLKQEHKEMVNVLRECASGVGGGQLVDDPQRATFLTPQMTGALLDYQNAWRSRRLFEEAVSAGTDIRLDKLAGTIVDRLIPKSFTDLPVPLAAAGAFIRDKFSHGKLRPVHLRITKRALEWAFELAIPHELSSVISQRCPRNSNDLVTLWPEDRAIGTLGTLDRRTRSTGDLSVKLYSTDDPLLLRSGEELEAVWTIHSDGPSLGWPDGSQELADRIHKPLSQILRVAETYAAWYSSEDTQDLRKWLEDRVESTFHNTTSLYAQFKLRDNLGERYYSLISRLLFADEATVAQRRNELRFMLTISATPPGYEVPIEISELVEDACEAAVELRRLVVGQLGSKLIGTSSCVRVRHHLYWSSEERERTKEAVTGFGGEELWQVVDSRFGYIRRLLHQLQIRGALVRKRFPQDYYLEDDRFRWGKLFNGNLQLHEPEVIEGVTHVNTDLHIKRGNRAEGMPLRCVIRPKFTFLTELHPINSRDFGNNWLARSRDQEGVLSKLEAFLNLKFKSIQKSESKTNGTLNAALHVGTNENDSTQRYLEKVEPIVNLFKEMMDERFQAVDAAEKVAKEEGRAKMAELLVSGTSHALKIPIKVAKARAEEGNCEGTARILDLAIPFVHVGAYIQDQERRKRSGDYSVADYVKWIPSPSPIKNAITLNESTIEALFGDALDYVAVARLDDASLNIVRLFRNYKEDRRRFQINWQLPTEYFLDSPTGIVFKRASSVSGVFQAALLEFFANAIVNTDPLNPKIKVELFLNSEDEHQLVIGIANNCQPKWKDSGELEAFLEKDEGLVGIRTAKLAIQALGWSLEARAVQYDGEDFQRFDVHAPVGKGGGYVQYFVD